MIGVYSDEEGPVTARVKSALAQRTRRKVQVLQSKLHRAAKEDKRKRGGIKRKHKKLSSAELIRLGLYQLQGKIQHVD